MFFSFDHLVYIAKYKTPELHSHFAKHIIFSLNGKLTCTIKNELIECYGIFIQSDVAHTVSAEDGKMIVFLFDEICDASKVIDNVYLCGTDYKIINEKKCDYIRNLIKEKSLNKKTDYLILQDLNLYKNVKEKIDERIASVLDCIKNVESLDNKTIKLLCNKASLSESRLSHLFKEQVGITLASYMMFAKLAKTYEYIVKGENITEASIHAGFSSSAHFASVNKRNFGISARNLEDIQSLFKLSN